MRVAVLVSSRVAEVVPLSAAWAQAGDAVTVVLLDAAVAGVRPGHAHADLLAGLCQHGVRVLAHDDALERRGLAAGALVEGVAIVDLDDVADLVTSGADRAVWW